jgi:hypothetical protein
MSLWLSQNQEEFGGAGLKCPPEHWAARDGRPTGIRLLEELCVTDKFAKKPDASPVFSP